MKIPGLRSAAQWITPSRVLVRRDQAVRSEIAQLTVWADGFEESLRLWKVGEVQFFEMISRAGMCEAGQVMISGLEGLVHGVSKDTGCS